MSYDTWKCSPPDEEFETEACGHIVGTCVCDEAPVEEDGGIVAEVEITLGDIDQLQAFSVTSIGKRTPPMANTPTREHREEELRDRAEVLVDRASQGWGIAYGHYAALVRAVTQALADAEQRGFERGREAEKAEVVAWLRAYLDICDPTDLANDIEAGKHLAKEE